MKIAIISDIHSNLEALQACLQKAASLGVDQYACLGDVVGYGPDPAETLETIRALPKLVIVRGNHEEALFGTYYKGLREHIRATIDWTREQLSTEQREYLKNLPYQTSLAEFHLVHASAKNPQKWPYVYDTELARDCMQASDRRLTFLGHTHYPEVYYEGPSGEVLCHTPQAGVSIPIYTSSRYVINVGSVGQPRDDNNAASFVVYNSAEKDVTFHRVPYDFSITAKKIIDRGLPQLFAERLATGN
ncbi:MAG: metallophosphoesterase family protein [Gammaproteobacteria bacterium]|nr:metallophosphoesterase family protein [Gammaproteobacteria bacterium]